MQPADMIRFGFAGSKIGLLVPAGNVAALECSQGYLVFEWTDEIERLVVWTVVDDDEFDPIRILTDEGPQGLCNLAFALIGGHDHAEPWLALRGATGPPVEGSMSRTAADGLKI